MLIGKNWKIESDNLNVILSQKKRRTNKETGKAYDYWKPIGYYSTIPNAMHGLVDQGIRDTELLDFETIIAKINELHNLIEPLCKRPRAKSERSKVS